MFAKPLGLFARCAPPLGTLVALVILAPVRVAVADEQPDQNVQPARKWRTAATTTPAATSYRDYSALQNSLLGFARPPANVPLEKGTYLGLATSPAAPVLRKQLKLSDGMGLVVDYVEPDSPAQSAGLEPYDVLVRLNEQILINPQQLAVLVRTFDPGTEVKLALLRGGKETSIPVTLVERDVKPLAFVEYGIQFANQPAAETFAAPRAVDQNRRRNVRQAPPDSRLNPEECPALGPAAVERPMQRNDLVRFSIRDMEGPGVTTLKAMRVDGTGCLKLPHLDEPVPAVGKTPKEFAKKVRELYSEAGVPNGGSADVIIVSAAADGEASAPATTAEPTVKPSAPTKLN